MRFVRPVGAAAVVESADSLDSRVADDEEHEVERRGMSESSRY